MSSAKLIELLVGHGRPMSELVRDLPSYVVVRRKVPLPLGAKAPVMERVRTRLMREAERTVTIEGVKAFYTDGWLLVRPSATEPICRIFAEGRTADGANARAEAGARLVIGLVAALPDSGPPSDLWCAPA
jgi:phosphomannomutase/phosphoglucomutase